MPRGLYFCAALLLVLVVITGCSPAPTPTLPPPTRRPTRTPPPTATPAPTQPVPTVTPLPTETTEPSPTATVAPVTPVPLNKPAPSTNSGITVWTMAPLIAYFSKIGAPMLPLIARAANINPLTGLPVSDPALLQRRPILARIGNDPSARAVHAGFNQADLVFEEMIDQRNMVFAITRFTLVFWGQDAAFRPLRSARAVNASLMPMFDGVLISSGGSKGTRFMISQLPWQARNLDGDLQGTTICLSPGDYRLRVASSTQHVQQYAASKGQEGIVSLRGFQFSDAAPGGAPANTILFDRAPWPYRAAGITEWRYNASLGKYQRFVNGTPHNTQNYALDGKWGGACALGAAQTEQIAAANVVVLNVKYEPTDFVEDTLNSYSAFIEMTGTGTAQVFRDGIRVEARWERPTLSDFFKLTDANGNEIALKPGNTWFELAPLNYAPTVR